MSCIVCSLSAPEIVVLTNGQQIHESCLQLDLAKNKALKMEEISSLYKTISNTHPNYSFFDYLFGNKDEERRHREKINRLNNEIEKCRKDLDLLGQRENEFSSKFSNQISTAIQHWPGYPPVKFWNQLRSEAGRRANWRCKECSRYVDTHGDVHHKIPLAMGGLNEISNLVYLCRKCHLKRHSVQSFPGTNKNPKSPKIYSEMSIREKINLSLSMKRRLNIVYIDDSGNETQRWISIERRFNINDGPSWYYVEAFCHLRKEKRTFKVDRIKEAHVYGMSDEKSDG